MLWIHGGRNSGGTGASDFFAEGRLQRHGVVLVHVFGSFATGRRIGGSDDDADHRLSDTMQRH